MHLVFLCIKSGLQTPLKVQPSLPASAASDLTEHTAYAQSLEKIYRTNKESRLTLFWCAGINEISTHVIQKK